VQDLIDPKYDPMGATEDGQLPRIMSVKAFVDGEAPDGRLTPLDVAAALDGHAETGLRRVERPAAGTDKELRLTLGDMRAMAWLGRYYAAKIRGAVDLYRFQRERRPATPTSERAEAPAGRLGALAPLRCASGPRSTSGRCSRAWA
jgi:hypothetical protein